MLKELNKKGSSVLNANLPTLKLPTLMNADEIMSMEMPEPKWAVPNTIPEGLTILAGNPKMGKSWLALGLSVAVASGGQTLGNMQVESGDVLYLALEDTPQRIQSRLKAISTGETMPKNLDFSTDWPRFDNGGLELLASWLESHPQARLVIIDTLTKVRPARRSSSNVYGEDYEHMGALKNIADQHGVAILVIHHTNKAGASDDPIEAVSGSFGLTGAADGILILKRARGQHEAVLSVTGRDVEEQEIALKWEPDTCSWIRMGDAADFQLDADQQKLIEILSASEKSLSPKELVPLLGKNDSTVRQMVSRMAKKGIIKSQGYGQYTSVGHSCHAGHTSSKEAPPDDNLSVHDAGGDTLLPENI